MHDLGTLETGLLSVYLSPHTIAKSSLISEPSFLPPPLLMGQPPHIYPSLRRHSTHIAPCVVEIGEVLQS